MKLTIGKIYKDQTLGSRLVYMGKSQVTIFLEDYKRKGMEVFLCTNTHTLVIYTKKELVSLQELKRQSK